MMAAGGSPRRRTLHFTALLVLWGGLGMLVGGLRYASQPATYESSARLYVHYLGAGEPGDFARNAGAIRSQAVTAKALQRIRDQSPAFLGKEHLTARRIFDGLKVVPDDMGSPVEGLVTIGYRAPSAVECEVVLQAVVDAYLTIHQDLQHPFAAEFLEKLEFARHELLGILRQPDAADRGAFDIPDWLSAEANGPDFHHEYASLQQLIGRLDQRRARLEGELLGLEHAQTAGLDPSPETPLPTPGPASPNPRPSPPPRVTAADELREDLMAPLRRRLAELSKQFGPDHVQVQETRKRLDHIQLVFETEPYINRELVELLVELQLLRENFGEGHPRIAMLKKQIEELRTLLREKVRGDSASDEVVETPVAGSPSKFVSAELDDTPTSVEQRQERVRVQLAEVNGELLKLRPVLEQAHARRLFQIVTNQLDSIQWAREHGGVAVHLLDPVGEARQVSRSLFLYLVLGLAGGLATGLAVCLVLTFLGQFANSGDVLPAK